MNDLHVNDPCERCHQRPNSWFTSVGYLCHPCTDEWMMWRLFFVENLVVGVSRTRLR